MSNADIRDWVFLGVIVVWFIMDRFNIYFRKG